MPWVGNTLAPSSAGPTVVRNAWNSSRPVPKTSESSPCGRVAGVEVVGRDVQVQDDRCRRPG